MQEYKVQAYREKKKGDILVADFLAGRTGDPHGILPTFDYRNLDTQFWKKINQVKHLYPGAGMDFGYDFVIYEFQGGDWLATLPEIKSK